LVLQTKSALAEYVDAYVKLLYHFFGRYCINKLYLSYLTSIEKCWEIFADNDNPPCYSFLLFQWPTGSEPACLKGSWGIYTFERLQGGLRKSCLKLLSRFRKAMGIFSVALQKPFITTVRGGFVKSMQIINLHICK
jgi:hypothetical protein